MNRHEQKLSSTETLSTPEGAAEAYQKLADLLRIAGFIDPKSFEPGIQPVVSNRLEGMGQDDPSGWRLVYKTSIGGYSNHLSFAKPSETMEGLFHEISVTEQGPWEPRGEIVVLASDKAQKLRGIYNRGEGNDYLYIRLDSQSAKDPSVGNSSGDKRRPAQPEDISRFEQELAELHSQAQAYSGSATKIEAA